MPPDRNDTNVPDVPEIFGNENVPVRNDTYVPDVPNQHMDDDNCNPSVPSQPMESDDSESPEISETVNKQSFLNLPKKKIKLDI